MIDANKDKECERNTKIVNHLPHDFEAILLDDIEVDQEYLNKFKEELVNRRSKI